MNDTELQALYSLRNEYRSLRYDLGNIKALCQELGNPQGAFRSVLVAGTNGKGSVARWLSGMVPRAGLFVSPHLERINERISIGGEEIGDRDLRALLEEVDAASVLCGLRLLYPPTYFERVAATAFCYFRGRTSHAVLEVGLGGRLDATNVVSQDVSVITNIGLDHQEHLGETLDAIAFEKAGIIKDREPVVIGPRCDAAVIRQKAGDRLIETRPLEPALVELGAGFFELDLETPVRRYRGVRPSLAGRHQIENAVLAIRAGECLEQLGWPIDESSIIASIQTSCWPGRLERFPGDPPFLLDGAHNPDAARALSQYLGSYHPRGVCLVFGAMSGKDCRAMLEVLAPHASTLILTRPRSERAASPAELAQLAGRPARVTDSVEEALRLARDVRRPEETVLVTGSLFVVGEARTLLVGLREHLGTS